MEEIQVRLGPVPITIYQKLRIDCGLSPKSTVASKIGLQHGLFTVSLINGEQVIGMGRVIGDGGCFCQVVDICVLPEFQGRGLGSRIMAEILRYIRNELPETCYVSLIADGDARHLYKKFGFKDTRPASRGMYLDR